MPALWDSSQRMIRRHAITIFIRDRVDGSPRGIIWLGTCRTLHPRWILHAPGVISVHGCVSGPGEPSDPELNALETGPPRPLESWNV